MKELVFCILLAILVPVFCPAQSDIKKQSNWVILAPKNEIFSVDVPGPLLPFVSNDGSERNYTGSMNGVLFLIYSQNNSFQPVAKTVLAYARTFGNESPTTFGAINGQEFRFRDEEGFFQTILYLKIHNREYIFHLLSRFENDPIVNHFFESLTISGESAPKRTSGGINENSVGGQTNKSLSQGSGDKPQEGETRAESNGQAAAEVNNPTPTPSATNGPITELKILSTPLAGYTDIARVYNIQGTVRLKVVFSENGSIGAVTPVAILPFGLTTNAITQARKIRFKPKIVNGVPVSVARVMEYKFQIY